MKHITSILAIALTFTVTTASINARAEMKPTKKTFGNWNLVIFKDDFSNETTCFLGSANTTENKVGISLDENGYAMIVSYSGKEFAHEKIADMSNFVTRYKPSDGVGFKVDDREFQSLMFKNQGAQEPKPTRMYPVFNFIMIDEMKAGSIAKVRMHLSGESEMTINEYPLNGFTAGISAFKKTCGKTIPMR